MNQEQVIEKLCDVVRKVNSAFPELKTTCICKHQLEGVTFKFDKEVINFIEQAVEKAIAEKSEICSYCNGDGHILMERKEAITCYVCEGKGTL